jgi:dihydroorotate dehydrogenase (NAD+) catalytic subunit
MGGIRTASDAIEFIIAGATAVAVGTWNFVEPNCAEKIAKEIEQYCTSRGINCICDLVGSLR